ncbi:MAG: hypothetical protein HY717_00950 [Planctomycetes bacterium]|nr:hypothetical protein [Planctomycetota bacterium]
MLRSFKRWVVAVALVLAAGGAFCSVDAQMFYHGYRQSSIYRGQVYSHHRPYRHHVSGHIGALNYSPFAHGPGYARYSSESFSYSRTNGYASGYSYNYSGPDCNYSPDGGYAPHGYDPYYYHQYRAFQDRLPRPSLGFVVGASHPILSAVPPYPYPRRSDLEAPWRIQMRQEKEALEGLKESQEAAPEEGTPKQEPSPPPEEKKKDGPSSGAIREEQKSSSPPPAAPARPQEEAPMRRGHLYYPDTGEIVDGSGLMEAQAPAPRKPAPKKPLASSAPMKKIGK